MKIYDRVDGVLKILSIPFFDTMPTFGEGEEPPLYVVYSLYDTPALSGDGRLTEVQYIVTLNVIGIEPKEVDDLQVRLLCIMQDYDFVYAGCNYKKDSDYVSKNRRIMDFKIQMEV